MVLRLLPKQFTSIILSSIALLAGYLIGILLPPPSFNTLFSHTSTNIPPTYLRLLNTASATKTDVLVASSCSPFDSYLSTKWSGMLLNTHNSERDRVTLLVVHEILGDKTAHAKSEMMGYAEKHKALSLDLDATITTCTNK
jgi:hypothetical protein